MTFSGFPLCRILFISWDGPQVNYLEGLFLPIFSRLREYNVVVHVLHLTWSTPDRVASNQASCKQFGVGYTHIPIPLRLGFFGQFFACLRAVSYLREATSTSKFDLLLPRSVIPGLICLLSRSFNRLPILYDSDGLAFDEKVDFAGLSPNSLFYRIFRDIEAQIVRISRKVLVRTPKAAEILLARAGPGVELNCFSVMSNGRDPTIFTPCTEHDRSNIRSQIGVDAAASLLIYVGSVGPQYCLAEMLGIFQQYRRVDDSAKLLIVTFSCKRVKDYLREINYSEDHVVLISAQPHHVPSLIAAADIGLALRSSAFSMQAVSPIKIGEYLLCGLPVITSGIEGVSMLDGSDVVKVLGCSPNIVPEDALTWIQGVLRRDRCEVQFEARALGMQYFSLKATVSTVASAICQSQANVR